MHTFLHGDTRFNYNSDLSGEVRIVSQGAGGHEDVQIPGEALLAFVAHYVRNRRISALEDAGDNDMYRQIIALEDASDAEVLGVAQKDLG